MSPPARVHFVYVRVHTSGLEELVLIDFDVGVQRRCQAMLLQGGDELAHERCDHLVLALEVLDALQVLLVLLLQDLRSVLKNG